MNTAASRTPEGEPLHCRVCQKTTVAEVSEPTGDAVCSFCGSLLWRLQQRSDRDLTLSTSFTDAFKSLDIVEMVMELEDEFGVSIPDDAAERFRTVEDLIRFLMRYKDQESEGA